MTRTTSKPNGTLWKELRQGRDYYLMLLPFGALFVCFILIPVVASAALSFTDFNMLQPPKFTGLENYIRMFLDDEIFLIAVKNTLMFALLTGPVSYVACLFFAWLVNELPPLLRSAITCFLYIPSMSSGIYVVWAFIFSGDQYGMINGFLMQLNLIREPVQWLTDTRYIMGVIIIVQLWLSLGTSFLSFIAGFQGIDTQQYEAAAIDGISNRLQEFWYITLPGMGPQLLFGAVMQIGASFAAGSVGSAILSAAGAGGAAGVATDYAATTLATHMAEVGTARFEMGYASALAVLLFVAMVLFNYLIRRMLRRFTD